jgi:hypothetical protein
MHEPNQPLPQRTIPGESEHHVESGAPESDEPSGPLEPVVQGQPKLNRLEKLARKKAQLENQIRAIHARENEKARRERTRRLIQIGALALKSLNLPDSIEPAAFEQVMQRVVAAHGQQAQEDH